MRLLKDDKDEVLKSRFRKAQTANVACPKNSGLEEEQNDLIHTFRLAYPAVLELRI